MLCACCDVEGSDDLMDDSYGNIITDLGAII